ncbi:hypothetical protein VB780_02950 [Leptolyngbya sp. CCNP1308]|uniref:hypothetical protein n=1 Tax=Leptolyngbya sp. CCNP1308 TaxID=3110255 RepID=UPI002B2056E0|nr:hypothetical protein [Leptolyngbya sp. CCNP1308]MEA5447512.1 hypothetical protein [Leptolyngbya sp. CCNP1308]
MGDVTDCEKLAGVFNRASEQGKGAFCQMLWGNQPEDVQAQLKPLLSQSTIDLLDAAISPPQ